MAKPFKIFLWIVGALIALLALAAIALPLIIDPNNYKGRITGAVGEETGRELTIGGDIGLTLFPWLGLELQDVTLANAKGFGDQPFAHFDEVEARIRVLPLLFDRRVEVGRVLVDGLVLNLAKAADGTNNWADLAEPKDEADKPAAPPSEAPAGEPLTFSVGSVEIKNATFSYADAASGAAYKIENLNVTTGKVEPGEPLDVTLGFLANATQPQVTADVKLALTVLADTAAKVYELQKMQLELVTSGPTIPGGKQEMKARATARYDQGKGSFTLADAVVEAGGLNLTANAQGEGLGTETPKLTGKLATNTFSPRVVAQGFGVVLPPSADASVLSQASFAADIGGDPQNVRLGNLTLKLDQTTATGFVDVKNLADPAIEFALKADKLDADRYLPPPADGKAAKKEEQPANQGSGEIPIDALDKLDVRGTAELAALTLKGVAMSNVKLTLNAPKGQVKTQELSAQLYGGRIVQSARITPGATPKYDVKAGLEQINAAPLLQALADKQFLSGLGNLNLGITTSGKTTDALLAALNGSMAASLVNGAIEGINLQQTLEQAKALYRREAMPAAAAGPARTEFRDFKTAGKIVNGVLKTDSLSAKGAWYNLGGDGSISLVGQTIDYVLKPTITGSTSLKELEGTTIPVRISGPLFSPKVKVDLEGVLKDRAKQEVKQELKKQEDKLKGKLGEELDRFFRKQAPAQPAPAEPEAQPQQETPPPS